MSLHIQLPRNYLTILTHLSLWVMFLGLPLLFEPVEMNTSRLAQLPSLEVRRFVGVGLNLCLISFFYLNYAWLLPRLYLKGKVWKYLLSVLGIFAVFQMVIVLFRNFSFSGLLDPTGMNAITRFIHVISSGFFVLMWGTSSGFRLGEEWRRTEKSRLEAELTLLKSQINPHFLINSLNNLYALSLTTPEKTPDAVLKLSEMVAYILYECDKPKIALASDLQFVENYVALQRLRMPPNAVLNITLPVESPPGAEIEPMILLPFIENAFKHGLTTKEPCTIDVSIKMDVDHLVLIVENPVLPLKIAQNGNVSGIGLSNTQRRLEYTYHGKHDLKMKNDGVKYRVELTLML